MDWIHFLALIYFCIITPLASFGTLCVYVLVVAFYSAREERLKEQQDANWEVRSFRSDLD
jgi:hypothetical protein